MRHAAALAFACTVSLVAPANAYAAEDASASVPRFEARVERIGTSVQGRAITAVVRGRSDATVGVLVVGVVHGNEVAGAPILRTLSRSMPPGGVRYWLVPSINPDGQLRATRQNARGVDLNRNFPFQWRSGGRPFDTFFPGRSRASEPETRAMLALVRRVRPDATVWYHQHATMVIRPPLPWRIRLARTYERVSRLAMRTYPGGRLHGTASSWQHAEQPRSAALVVELPAGRLPASSVARHAAAVRALAVAAAADGIAP